MYGGDRDALTGAKTKAVRPISLFYNNRDKILLINVGQIGTKLEMMETSCTLRADMSGIQIKEEDAIIGEGTYWKIAFDICTKFDGGKLYVFLKWKIGVGSFVYFLYIVLTHVINSEN